MFSAPSPDDPTSSVSHVTQINARTGQIVRRTPFGDGTELPPFVFAAAFNSRDELFVNTLNSSPLVDAVPLLAKVDLATGLATAVMVVDRTFTGLAFGPNDELFGVNPIDGLVHIDLAAKDETVIGGDLVGAAIFGATPSLAFDRDGTLYAAADGLWTVDPQSGTATPVGGPSTPFSFVGLTVPPVPEPGSAAGFCIGLVFADSRGRPLNQPRSVVLQRLRPGGLRSDHRT